MPDMHPYDRIVATMLQTTPASDTDAATVTVIDIAWFLVGSKEMYVYTWCRKHEALQPPPPHRPALRMLQ